MRSVHSQHWFPGYSSHDCLAVIPTTHKSFIHALTHVRIIQCYIHELTQCPVQSSFYKTELEFHVRKLEYNHPGLRQRPSSHSRPWRTRKTCNKQSHISLVPLRHIPTAMCMNATMYNLSIISNIILLLGCMNRSIKSVQYKKCTMLCRLLSNQMEYV